MRPGGLGSTQLIQKLAQLAWYWWPPYSSLKLSVSELNACQSERLEYVRRETWRQYTQFREEEEYAGCGEQMGELPYHFTLYYC